VRSNPVVVDIEKRSALCGFSPGSFRKLHEPLSEVLTERERDRAEGIGPTDACFVTLPRSVRPSSTSTSASPDQDVGFRQWPPEIIQGQETTGRKFVGADNINFPRVNLAHVLLVPEAAAHGSKMRVGQICSRPLAAVVGCVSSPAILHDPIHDQPATRIHFSAWERIRPLWREVQ
jgi:hypothetical protein